MTGSPSILAAGNVAVLTGAGSGFGRELALLCAARGMKLVLADIQPAALDATVALLPAGTEMLALPCDVSKAAEVMAMAEQTYARFGAAHLLFNNAGVSAGGFSWQSTEDDWSWVLGVNLMGVVHGIRAFVPRMLAAGDPAHVVNTASAAGLVSVPGSSIYCVSKHGVVTLSECLYHELRGAAATVNVSVLCPAFVPTGILDSARNRPAELARVNPTAEVFAARRQKAITSGRLSAADIAQAVADAVDANRFYILPHERIKRAIEVRMHDILEGRQPTDTMPK
ncbi:SDR family NAD(P)-dependent oxidoreductase [Ferrovibrio xuzhouensis]|uniref:SDR family NAD(P)-dependent oxidoreductase n=1 Tax=Ferrovibrio xuzhouensis TaxID=1576914 RepID=A0ABV7VHQ2_9PROT